MEDVEVVLMKNWMRRKAVEELVRRRMAQKAADKRWRRFNGLCNAAHILTGVVSVAGVIFVMIGAILPMLAACGAAVLCSMIAGKLEACRERACVW